MTQVTRIAVMVIVAVAGFGLDFADTAMVRAQDAPPTAVPVNPGPPPGSAPPQSSSAVPVVQKNYIFEYFYVPLLIVAALTAICRSSNRS